MRFVRGPSGLHAVPFGIDTVMTYPLLENEMEYERKVGDKGVGEGDGEDGGGGTQRQGQEAGNLSVRFSRLFNMLAESAAAMTAGTASDQGPTTPTIATPAGNDVGGRKNGVTSDNKGDNKGGDFLADVFDFDRFAYSFDPFGDKHKKTEREREREREKQKGGKVEERDKLKEEMEKKELSNHHLNKALFEYIRRMEEAALDGQRHSLIV